MNLGERTLRVAFILLARCPLKVLYAKVHTLRLIRTAKEPLAAYRPSLNVLSAPIAVTQG
jgi:hypothetical protein